MSSERKIASQSGATALDPGLTADVERTSRIEELSENSNFFPEAGPAFSTDLGDAQQLFSLGNFSSSLRAARRQLESEPDNPPAIALVGRCTEILEEVYLARLGDVLRVPVVIIPERWLLKLRLDTRRAYVLSLIGQGFSYEEVLDAMPFERLDGLEILAQLVEAGVIGHQVDEGGPHE